jgi:hypothetical protein
MIPVRITITAVSEGSLPICCERGRAILCVEKQFAQTADKGIEMPGQFAKFIRTAVVKCSRKIRVAARNFPEGVACLLQGLERFCDNEVIDDQYQRAKNDNLNEGVGNVRRDRPDAR